MVHLGMWRTEALTRLGGEGVNVEMLDEVIVVSLFIVYLFERQVAN